MAADPPGSAEPPATTPDDRRITRFVHLARERHASVAVPFGAMRRNRAVAASVLAGGVAYRLFLWLLPFSLVVGGALGLGHAQGIEEAVGRGGLPAAMVTWIGAAARAANANSWWLFLAGFPLLLWEGYAGAKGLSMIHALVWRDEVPRTRPLMSSLAFSAGMCVMFATVSATWWLRGSRTLDALVVLLMVLPVAALWLLTSLRLPHGEAHWTALLPGALLVGIGFQVAHGLVLFLLGPKLEKATSLYAGFGVATTILFFLWVVGWIVVTAPILNNAVDAEIRVRSSLKDPT